MHNGTIKIAPTFTWKRNYFTTHLKSILRYYYFSVGGREALAVCA